MMQWKEDGDSAGRSCFLKPSSSQRQPLNKLSCLGIGLGRFHQSPLKNKANQQLGWPELPLRYVPIARVSLPCSFDNLNTGIWHREVLGNHISS